MFRDLPPPQPDPILSLAAAFESDADPDRVDLGIGVYKDEAGRSPVLESVKRAEAWLIENQTTKAYLSSAGAPEFNDQIRALLFGAGGHERVRCLQAAGGSGALRVLAELMRRSRPTATVWVPRPTWANHLPIMKAAHVAVREYGYYDRDSARLQFDSMLTDLRAAARGDIVLVHGCCHNPSGADLSADQWRELAHTFSARGLMPLVDIAYQGFAAGLDEDVAGLRLLSESVPELLVASSCSKNFSLYRERTGAVCVVAESASDADKAAGAMLGIIRALYSMPPDHGAAVVAHILQTPQLRTLWSEELAAMRTRIHSMRARLAAHLTTATAADFSYIERQNGMFSFLDLTASQVDRLRQDFHVHAVSSGRINVAGLSTANVGYVARAVAAVMAA
jgi:aspartate/tyrosine/aromatic aminotransferase